MGQNRFEFLTLVKRIASPRFISKKLPGEDTDLHSVSKVHAESFCVLTRMSAPCLQAAVSVCFHGGWWPLSVSCKRAGNSWRRFNRK